MLGSGQFGKVFLGHNSSKPEIKVAIKTLSKKELDVNKIKSEIQILSRLDHPNICKYYEAYDSPNNMYLIMEYCSGGHLLQRLGGELSKLSEDKAR